MRRFAARRTVRLAGYGAMGRVRSKANALSRILDDHPYPVYVVDRQRTIIYCNAACGLLNGVDPDSLVGQSCEYRAAGDDQPAEVAARLCPPPEALAGAFTRREITVFPPGSAPRVLPGWFFPLLATDSAAAGVLAVLGAERATARAAARDAIEMNAAELHTLLGQLQRQLRGDAIRMDELIGVGPAIRRVREQIRLAVVGQPRLVVLGPAGSGRELVARAVYARSLPPTAGPIVPLCCPLLDPELIQMTIKALVRQFGAAESGQRPSLLLLEVDQLPVEAQDELAGFLSLPGFDLHTIATASESLQVLADRQSFRHDLAHALSTLVIELPALRDRPQDVPLLCQHFVERFNARGGRQLSGFSDDALDELTTYPWPENVDELAEVVAEACARATGPLIERAELPNKLRWAFDRDAHPRKEEPPINLDQLLADVEAELIQRALRRAKGNKTRAATLLGITRARLHRRLEQLDTP